MCNVFIIFILQTTNCNLTAKYFSTAIPATEVLYKQVVAGISVSCSFNCFAVPVNILAENHSPTCSHSEGVAYGNP